MIDYIVKFLLKCLKMKEIGNWEHKNSFLSVEIWVKKCIKNAVIYPYVGK